MPHMGQWENRSSRWLLSLIRVARREPTARHICVLSHQKALPALSPMHLEASVSPKLHCVVVVGGGECRVSNL